MILALLSVPSPARGADFPERKTVVLLYPDSRLLPESIAVEQGIRSTLQPGVAPAIDFYTEYLDLGLLSEDQSKRPLTQFLRQKYQGRKVDLVIPVAFPSLHFFLQHRSIVDLHGGRLEAQNNQDGGATFSFTLPIGDDGP